MTRGIIFVSILMMLYLGSYAQGEAESPLTGTVHIYPAKFQKHDILYFSLELQNKGSIPVRHPSFHRDMSVIMALQEANSTDNVYFFPYDGALNAEVGYSIIEPGQSSSIISTFVEFPEYLTLHSSRTALPSFTTDKVEGVSEIRNKDFIENYVGTGRKCQLSISLFETGLFISESIEVKSRNTKEMAAIEAWHSKFGNFLSDTLREIEHHFLLPSAKDYEDFEKQLSQGTLKNYIHYRKLLASIPDSPFAEIPSRVLSEHFKVLGKYLDTLHPIERQALIREALWYFSERSSDGKRMKYLLLPKLPRIERPKYFSATELDEQKMFLELPEPDEKAHSSVPSARQLE